MFASDYKLKEHLRTGALAGLALTSLALVLWVTLQGILPQRKPDAAGMVSRPETVEVAPASIRYHAPGAFLIDGAPVNPPLIRGMIEAPLEVMRQQVSVGEYALCVANGACRPADIPHGQDPDLPVTGVSHLDALAYADWLSQETGQRWRLPTEAEWAVFAAERWQPPEPIRPADADNPAMVWLERYKRYARPNAPVAAPAPGGAGGANSLGIEDIGGRVWEWTSGCYTRVHLDPAAPGRAAKVAGKTTNCGVRIAQGQHRAYISAFIRDAKAGGCAMGTPPDHLGFRLVREVPRFPWPAWWLQPFYALP